MLISLALGGASGVVAAAEGTKPFELGVSAGLIYSDNLRLSEADRKVSGTIVDAGLLLHHERQGSRLDSNANVDLRFQHYMDSEYDDSILGGADVALMADLVADRFQWFVHDNFGQSRVSAFEAVTPDNRQNFNVFTTGPDLHFRLTGSTELQLSGRYALATYEASNLDSDTFSGTVELARELSDSSRLSLTGTGSDYSYREVMGGSSDFRRYEGFGSYSAVGRRTEIRIDAGYSSLDGAGVQSSSGGELLRAGIRRRISSASTLGLSFGAEYTSAVDRFTSVQDAQGPNVDPSAVLVTASAFRRNYVGADWDFRFNRTTLTLGAEYNRENYLNDPLVNRSRWSFVATASRRLTPTLRASLALDRVDEKFEALGSRARDYGGAVTFDWRAGRSLQWFLGYAYHRRSAEGGFQAYSSNLASLRVQWSSGYLNQ